MKDLLIRKPVDSNLNEDQSNVLAKKTVRDVLEFYVKNDFIQNISRPKLNYKIVYWTLPPFRKSIQRTFSGKAYKEHYISKLL